MTVVEKFRTILQDAKDKVKTSEEAEMDKEEGTHYEYYSMFDLDADTITLA